MKKIEINNTEEFIYYDKSKYNMPIYIWENKNLNGFYISLCVKYGSLHTKFKYRGKEISVPSGIAHYLEHIKFNEKKGVKANDYYDKLGSDINAFTTFEYTNYEVSAHEHYKENLSHLIYYVLNPYFTKDIINKERGIITEEIKMDKDDPYSRLFYRSLKNIFHTSNYRNLVSGEIDEIKQITLEDINTVFNLFYHPENMFLVVSGNVDKYQTIQIVNDTLDKIKINKYIKPTILSDKEPVKVHNKEDIYKDNVITPKAKLSIKIPLNKIKNLDKEEIYIYTKLILDANFGNTSDFKEELLENNMAASFSAYRNVLDEYLIITFSYESDVYNAVRDKILEKIKNLDITPSFLKRVIKCCIANLILGFDNKEMVSSMIQKDIIEYDEIINNIYDIYNNIKISDLNKLAKIFNSKNISFTVAIPKE